jgi:hypothetical protein
MFAFTSAARFLSLRELSHAIFRRCVSRLRPLVSACLLVVVMVGGAARVYAATWQVPTAEELAMTSQPQVPGAPAVYLFREEIADDNMHFHSMYVRLKVLSEKGKSYADVELPYISDTSITEIAGRTIQPDGSEVPFTGKPYTKTLMKDKTSKLQAKVFTMPAVQVGSILEYRYTWRYDEHMLSAPEWFVQRDLYMRSGHFLWKPFDTKDGYYLVTGQDGKIEDRLAWAQILPVGAKVETKTLPGKPNYFELHVHDIAPIEEEESALPMHSVSMRVEFYYTGATSEESYWRDAGKNWSKNVNSFIGSGSEVRTEVGRVTAPGDTPEVKLKKIYADVMTLNNTDFARQKDASESKLAKSANDILKQKSGSGDQLTMLFVAMARAAGLKADVALIANRNEHIFWPPLLSFGQLDDYIAIVTADGKEVYLDPGQRDCPYGLMAWKHTDTQGVRQAEGGGTGPAQVPLPVYLSSQVQRVGDLTMDKNGAVLGSVKMTWLGNPALAWRQRYLRSDTAELNRALKESMDDMLPSGMKASLASVQNLEDYEKPLVVNFTVDGRVGTTTSKRMIVPAQFFETTETPRFTATKRTLPIDLHYGSRTIDAVRLVLPANMHWEVPPPAKSIDMKTEAMYRSSAALNGNAIIFRRQLDIGAVILMQEEYAALHDFYAKVASADEEQGVIGLSTEAAEKSATETPAAAQGTLAAQQ